MKKLEVGKIAPKFKLKNQDGEIISLSDYKGEKNVVIYFYPKAMTPGCTTQACEIKKNKRKFTSRDTVVLGLSPDPVDKLDKFRVKEKLNFDLLSDEGHKVADKYGVWGEKKFMGKVYDGIHRRTFIVGKDGKIKHIMEKVKTKSHHEDVLNFIKENL